MTIYEKAGMIHASFQMGMDSDWKYGFRDFYLLFIHLFVGSSRDGTGGIHPVMESGCQFNRRHNRILHLELFYAAKGS